MAMTRTELQAQQPELRRRLLGRARAKLRGADAEDVVQEALYQICRGAERVDADKLVPWSFGVLRHVICSLWREAGRASFVPLVDEATGEDLDVAVDATQETWCEVQEALRLIASLPAERQSLFVEVALLGNSLAEAAEARRLPLGTVKSRLYRTWDGVRDAAKGRCLPKAWAA
jgi:DNA-directed RNA polymerase specialized sigma24 family protein